MPLISCPDCRHEISDRATACPYCGRPMHADSVFDAKLISSEKTSYEATSQGKESVSSGCSGCFLSLLIAFILFSVLLFNFQGAAVFTALVAFFAAWGLWLLFPVIFIGVLFFAALKFLLKK